jgi:hypothetical protein
MASQSFRTLVPAAAAVAVGIRAVSSRKASRTTARTAGVDPVPIDPTYGDLELGTLRRATAVRDWPAMAAILGAARERSDYERLTFLLAGIEDLDGEHVLTLLAQDPDDRLVATVGGARAVAWAWEARTKARATLVSQEQFRIFHDRLRLAEEHLYRAVELDPDSAAPWFSLLVSCRGLQHGEDIARRRFEAGVRRAPYHSGLHRQMLQQLCRKWGGSDEKALAFARESVLKAPPGGALGGLVAEAHAEAWLDLTEEERATYMGTPEVVASLNEAAALSVDHPDFRRVPHTVALWALNAFAMTFWLAGEYTAAWRMFVRIGDYPTPAPWHYRGNPSAVFAMARAECKSGKQGKPDK